MRHGQRRNARRAKNAGLDEDVLHWLLEGEAETFELDSDAVYVTPALRAEARRYDDAVYEALQALVRKYPTDNGATADDLWEDNAAYLILMTLRGEGVGIWDGDWDEYYDNKRMERGGDVWRFLNSRLSAFTTGTGEGTLGQALMDAAYETAGEGEDELHENRHRRNADTDRIPSAREWFRRFPDLGRDPLFTIRLKLPCGNVRVRAWEGPEFTAVGSYPTHTRLFCELQGCGVRFPREHYYVGIPRSQSIDGDAAKEQVLALFALKPGDTDDEFFAEYTPQQLAFVEQYGEDIDMIRLDRYGEDD